MRRPAFPVRPPAGSIARPLAFLLVACALAGVGGAKAGVPDGLVAYWSFDQDFTATVGGGAYDGTGVNGLQPPVPEGRFGGGLRFYRSSSQYLSIDAPVVTPGQDHTYSAWYKTTWTSIAEGPRYFVLESKPNYSVSYGLRNIDGDGLDTIGEVFTQWSSGAANKRFDHGTNENQWNNIIVTYDASASLHTIYRNGALIGTMASHNPLSSTTGLVIGGHRDGTGRNWDGWIDDVGVWNRVLTADEIAALQGGPVVSFAEVATGLPGVRYAANAWGDYDGDGDLDLLLTGDTGGGYVCSLYESDGAGGFSIVAAGLPGVRYGAVAWGDQDGDGNLDLLLTGDTGGGYISRVYLGDGGGGFSLGATLPGVYRGRVGWGDYDNDGDLDILLTGDTGGGYISSVYRNDGGSFSDVLAGLPGVKAGVAAWGDYDLDGDLDILLGGGTSTSYPYDTISRVYRNDGGVFSDVGAGLPGLWWGAGAWGDCDGDGDLDVLISGTTTNGGTRIAEVYRNDGGGVFTDLNAGLQGVIFGSVAWADFDNDGDQDILLTGNGGGANRAYAYRNSGSGLFGDPQAGLVPVQYSSAIWGDHDGDGRLDALVSGDTGAGYVTALYHGELLAANTPPLTPGGLATSVTGDRVTFSWSYSADQQTPPWALGYDLRVGTTPGGGEVCPALAIAGTGERLVAQAGDVRQRNSWTLTLPPGQYYWSVQAVDGALAGSGFAGEQSLELASFTDIAAGLWGVTNSAVAWGDYDGDGDLDLALSGWASAWRARVYENAGGTFNDLDAGLEGVDQSSMAWGDYDGDGDLDLLVAGKYSYANAGSTRLYRNDAGTFTDVGASLVGVYNGSLAWGDFDNDGDLDILLTGDTIYYTPTTRIYRNDAGTFTDLGGGGLPDVFDSSVAWGDYDGDGDLDLLLTGYTGTTAISRVYRNDGGAFLQAQDLTGVRNGSVAWGDYDGDGDLDILLTGLTGGGTPTSLVCGQTAGAFAPIGAGLPGVSASAAAWGDYDNDGDLDILLSGDTGSGRIARVYRNVGGTFGDAGGDLPGVSSSSVAWGDYDADGDLDILLSGGTGSEDITRIYSNDSVPANTPPAAPGGLVASLVSSQLSVSWDAASDAQTPAAALSYNLRVGTTPGGGEICPAHALPADGLRLVPQPGNVQQARVTVLSVPAGGTYYVSVQAVDGGLAGSAFAGEQVVTAGWTTITAGPLGDTGDGTGVAWGDYDLDGDPDLYLGNDGQGNRLLRNDGPADFTDVTSGLLGDTGPTRGVAWGDCDSDGDLDLYVVNKGAPNKLLRNDGYGNFSDYTHDGLGDAGNGESAAWVARRLFGKIDLTLVNDLQPDRFFTTDWGLTYENWTILQYYSGGAGRSAAWGDYDNNGVMDVYLGNASLDGNKLLHSSWFNGAFYDSTAGPLTGGGPTYGTAWGDYDNDGDLDLYIGNDGQPNRLLRNDLSGAGCVFVDVTSGPLGDAGPCRSVSWIDYDNDGDLDLYLVQYGEENKLLRNDGGGVFTDATIGGVGDAGLGMGAAWADYDADGDLDLYLTNQGGANRLVRNDQATGNHWLQVLPIGDGVFANRLGVSTRVTVVAGGVRQIREISYGSGYLSQDDGVAAFGLGTATVADSVKVSWKRQSYRPIILTNVPTDQLLTVYYDQKSTVGGDLARCLGLSTDQFELAWVDASSFETTLGDSVEGSVLLSTGRAADGGLGSTDWSGTDLCAFTVRFRPPSWANSVRFTTQLISAEYEAGRPGVDHVSMVFWDQHAGTFQDARLDTIYSMSTGTVSPTLSHAIDLTPLGASPVLAVRFTVSDGSGDGINDTALKISHVRYSPDPLPLDEPLPPGAYFNYLQTPIFGDVSLIAGSYTYSKDLFEIPGPMPVRLSLAYNSDSVRSGRLGPKWSHGYEIHSLKLNEGQVVIRHGNGETTYFEPDGAGGYKPMYDGSHATLTETSPGSFTYQSESNLVYEFTPNGTWSDYGELAVIRDPSGNETTLTHTTNGDRLLERIDRITCGASRVDFTYTQVDTVELLTEVAVNDLRVADFDYDPAGRLTEIREYPQPGAKAAPIATAIAYDDQDRILTVTNGAGEREVANTYKGTVLATQLDAAGLVSRTTYEQDELAHVDRAGRRTVRHYDVKGRLDRIEHPGGAEVTYEYDADGNLHRISDPLGHATTMDYDADGNLTSKTDALGFVSTMTYDGRGNQLTRTDPGGKVWTKTYDGADRLLTEEDPLGNVITSTYHPDGQLATRTDALGHMMSYGYDAAGFPNRVTDALGRVTTSVNDDFGHATSVTDARGHTTHYTYTVDGRVLSRTDPEGGTTTYTYDGAGRILTETTSNAPAPAIVKTYTYTPTGLVASETDGNGATTSYGYDADGRRTSVTDPLGRTTTFTYDDYGHLIEVHDAEGGVASATYDCCSQLSQTDPGGSTYSTAVDPLGRVTSETDPLGHTTTYTYNSRGLIETMTNGRGITFSYAYDDAGRLTREEWPTGWIEHTLDGNSNEIATAASDAAGVTRTFDALDRILARTDAQGRTVQYEYDEVGNVTAVTYPDGSRVEYGYDAEDRMIWVRDWNGRTTTYSYTQAGDPVYMTRPDNSSVYYQYDAGQRVIAVTDSAGTGGLLFGASFTIDLAGNVTSADLTLPLEATVADVYRRFSYQGNQIVSVEDDPFTYDEDGNLVQGVFNGEMHDLQYDELGHLIRCGYDEYEYDTDGYRVGSTVGGVQRRYVYDTIWKTPRVLVEYDGAGNLVAKYVHGLGLVSRYDAGGDVRYYHFDTRGSTVALTRQDGTVSDRYAYGPYGEVLAAEGTTENPFRFVGAHGVIDDRNGLYLMKERYYAPDLLRFVQRDKVFDGDLQATATLNRHAYAEGNPISIIDPNGTWGWKSVKKLAKKVAKATPIGQAYMAVDKATNGGLTSTLKKGGSWAADTWRDHKDRIIAVAVGVAAGAVVSCVLGPGAGTFVASMVVGAVYAHMAGNLVRTIEDPEADWQWGYGIGGELVNLADWGIVKGTECEAGDNAGEKLACAGKWFYENGAWNRGPVGPGPMVGTGGGGLHYVTGATGSGSMTTASGQHDQMNDFWPHRDAFDGAMSVSAQSRTNAWALTDQVCPLKP